MDLEKRIFQFFALHGAAIATALGILIVGLFVARWLAEISMRLLERKELEPPIRMLLSRLIKLAVIAFALVIAAGQIGVQIMPLVAGIGVIGVGVGLATQGVLSNVVAGLTIIFTKPFRVGEYIELLGVYGQVRQIELFSTTLLHPDRSQVVIPNRKIVGEILHNYGSTRQLDLSVNVAYGCDLNLIQKLAREVVSQNKRVLADLPALIGISALGDSRICVSVKPWVGVNDYGPAQAELYQALVERFRSERIEVPYPSHEIRLVNTQQNENVVRLNTRQADGAR